MSKDPKPDVATGQTADAKLGRIFTRLWQDYVEFNPGALRIYNLLLEKERKLDDKVASLANDHIALRTYNIGKIALVKIARLFEDLGYAKQGEYRFDDKCLYAWHLEHPLGKMPKVFISELETEKFSPLVQETARKVEAAITADLAKTPELLWSRRSWQAEYSTYQALLKESEYAAWLYAFGFRSNHFTISVNDLKAFTKLDQLNEFIQESGFKLNAAGGLIKGSPNVHLEQSSTLAEEAFVDFAEGKFTIPACYYEFALRYPLANGRLYQGFVAASADKIFESTNVSR